ncbi:MAG: TraR/DksA C4-type zinc finger protein [Ginsengibacter sp.]
MANQIKKAAPAKKVVSAKKKSASVKKASSGSTKSGNVKPASNNSKNSGSKGAASKKANVAGKAVGKHVATKKAAANKALNGKSVSAKKQMTKKVTAAKTVKPIVKHTPAKKAANPVGKKAAPKKLATPKKTTTSGKASEHKKAIAVPDKKESSATKLKKAGKSDEPASKSKQQVKSESSVSKTEKKVDAVKKSQKPFVMPKTSTEKARKYEPQFVKSVLDQVQEENRGPSMRYSDNELIEFRELITRKLDTAKKELGYLQGLITRKDEMGGDDTDNRYMTMEDGSLSMEREQLSQMASRQITFIDHLEKAMMRIENKTYGICRVTGKLIDKARLRAVPHATLSIEAKMGISR